VLEGAKMIQGGKKIPGGQLPPTSCANRIFSKGANFKPQMVQTTGSQKQQAV